ncbi:hypothetical protein EDC90_10642 [Martelella mediterranea]|uniref:Uncharacterized protein n=1 Tax=Martelella mediterranea TaxID=293089 RepID=A0A4R3NCI9_9HYPH|nr:hypothetical protein EDC90_10642 [Martelella mediterranea]
MGQNCSPLRRSQARSIAACRRAASSLLGASGGPRELGPISMRTNRQAGFADRRAALTGAGVGRATLAATSKFVAQSSTALRSMPELGFRVLCLIDHRSRSVRTGRGQHGGNACRVHQRSPGTPGRRAELRYSRQEVSATIISAVSSEWMYLHVTVHLEWPTKAAIVTSVKPRSFATLAKLCRRMCGVIPANGEPSNICFQ